jgi:hypothetical protein
MHFFCRNNSFIDHRAKYNIDKTKDVEYKGIKAQYN